MSDWKTDKLKALSQLGSAVVVLLGLVFVGIELRQNTSAVEAATVPGLTDASNDFLLAIAANPDLARSWRAGLLDPAALDQGDALRFFLLTRSNWLRMQNAWSQYERGTFSSNDWENGMYKTFARHEFMLQPKFLEVVRNCPRD